MNNVIVLFPGAMKPFHDGHLNIINSYIDNINNEPINEIQIIISQKDRSGITAESTYNFLKKVFKDNVYKGVLITFQIADIPSPIKVCMGIAGHDETNTKFCLASSTKDKDDDRTNFFYKFFTEHDEGDKVIDLKVNRNPLLYNNRTDKFNGASISASIVRYDIDNNDFNNFKTSYANMLKEKLINISDLKKYFNILKEELIFDNADQKKIQKILNENLKNKYFISNKYRKINYTNNMNRKMRYNNHKYNHRKINESVSTDKTFDLVIDALNLNKDYNVDIDSLGESLEEIGYEIDGSADDNGVSMIVKNINDDDVKRIKYILENAFNIDDIYQYFGDMQDTQESEEDTDDEDTDDEEPENIEDEGPEDEETTYPSYDEIEADEDDPEDEDFTFPSYDEIEADEDEPEETEEDLNEPDEEYESRKFISRKRKKCNCISLNEAINELNEKKMAAKCTGKQCKLSDVVKKKSDMSIAKIKDILDDLKATKDKEFTEDIAKKAISKIKKENKNLVKAGVKISSIPQAKQILKKLAKFDPSVKDMDESLACKTLYAYSQGKLSLHENVTVNNKKLKFYNLKTLKRLINEANASKKSLRTKLNSINESKNPALNNRVKSELSNKLKLIKILSEEIEYRYAIAHTKLFEDEEPENTTLDASTGDQTIDASTATDSSESKDDSVEDVELSGIVFTMKNKAAADEFISTCVDSGVPEDALEIVDEDEDKDDKKKNESYRLPKHLRALLEDEEVSESDDEDDKDKDEDDDKKDDKDDDSTEDDKDDDKKDDDKPVKVRLNDTDYTEKVADVLNTNYGISKEDFEEKLGGSIVSDDEEESSTDKEADKEDDTLKNDYSEKEDPDNMEIDPNELFNFDDGSEDKTTAPAK